MSDRQLTAVVVLAGVVAIGGCSDDEVDPITKITAPRILAITAEPSVLAQDGEIMLTAFTVDPFGARIGVEGTASPEQRPVSAVRMRACLPWRVISDPNRDCGEDSAVPLAIAEDGTARISMAELEASLPAPPVPLAEALAAGISIRVPMIVEVDVDGDTLIARRDIEIVEAGVERRNPRIVEVRFDGEPLTTLQRDRRYKMTVTIDPQSVDDRGTMPGTAERVEVTFYSPSGELADTDADVLSADPGTPLLTSKPTDYTSGAAGPSWMFVVATDDTSGMGTLSVPLVE